MALYKYLRFGNVVLSVDKIVSIVQNKDMMKCWNGPAYFGVTMKTEMSVMASDSHEYYINPPMVLVPGHAIQLYVRDGVAHLLRVLWTGDAKPPYVYDFNRVFKGLRARVIKELCAAIGEKYGFMLCSCFSEQDADGITEFVRPTEDGSVLGYDYWKGIFDKVLREDHALGNKVRPFSYTSWHEMEAGSKEFLSLDMSVDDEKSFHDAWGDMDYVKLIKT